MLNSIPDCNVSLLAPISIAALALVVRCKIIRKLIKWMKKGKVIRMVRKVIAGPWWALAYVLGTMVPAMYGGSG